MHCKECNLRSEVQACLVSSQCRFVSSRFSFHYELNAILCIQFGLMIFGDDPKVQDMRPGLMPFKAPCLPVNMPINSTAIHWALALRLIGRQPPRWMMRSRSRPDARLELSH